MSVQPTLEALVELSRQDLGSGKRPNTFTVYKHVLADSLNQQSAYLKLARPGSADATPSFLLESALAGEKLSRYTFIGSNPRKIITTGPNTEFGEVDPLSVLEKELEQYTPAKQADKIPEFRGGAIGYISYDCIKYFEPKTARPLKDNLHIPEAVLLLCDTLVAFDNVFQRIYILHNIHIPDGITADAFDFKAAYAEAETTIDGVLKKLTGPDYVVPQKKVTANDEYVSNIGQEGYEKHVLDLKKHIVLGDIIQAVPSQRIAHPTDLHPFNIYRQLRTINPSPYMFYIDCLGFQLVGASPELLVKIEHGRVVTHPIAGTVKRGATQEEDERLANELLESEKDRAEHVMLVDLARNDINRVADAQTSSVDSFMTVHRFSHVSHLVSQCSGVLRPEKTRFDAFRSIFPAGTVSGAPKVRAMELISELEGEKRGVYAGAVGHWGYARDDMDTCIALRTMLYKDGTVYLQAGGGIVYDSDPYDEYMETMNKMRANKVCVVEAEKFWEQETREL